MTSDISIPVWYTITVCIARQAPLWNDSFQYHEILQTAHLFSIIIATVITTCISNSIKQIESSNGQCPLEMWYLVMLRKINSSAKIKITSMRLYFF